MKRHGFRIRFLVWLVLLAIPATARADDDGSQNFLTRLHYSLAGGLMDGVGTQGAALRRGPFGSVNVHGESATGMQLGVEAAYAASEDDYRTHYLSLGGIARLSPTPEDYRVFVQVGAAVYHVTFNPVLSLGGVPQNATRPGGSFGIGFDVYQGNRVMIGGIALYNNVVLSRTAARSYLTAAVNITFKPASY